MVSFKHEKNSHGIFINFHLFALKHEQENNIMMLYGYKSVAIKKLVEIKQNMLYYIT
jgi:hypothetical protein